MSVILATNESIRTPALSVKELVARSGPCKRVAVALLGGMAPNHSPLTQPFPMVKWLTDLEQFDAVFYMVGPHCHRYSRSDAPAADEPPLRDDEFLDEVRNFNPFFCQSNLLQDISHLPVLLLLSLLDVVVFTQKIKRMSTLFHPTMK